MSSCCSCTQITLLFWLDLLLGLEVCCVYRTYACILSHPCSCCMAPVPGVCMTNTKLLLPPAVPMCCLLATGQAACWQQALQLLVMLALLASVKAGCTDTSDNPPICETKSKKIGTTTKYVQCVVGTSNNMDYKPINGDTRFAGADFR